MIKKLRKKFVITALLSIFSLLTVILITINLINFSLVENDADRILEMIISDGGQFNDNGANSNNNNTSTNIQSNTGQNFSDGGGFQPTGPDSPEVSMTMRYFTIKFTDGVGSVEKLNVNIVNESEAIEWANELINYKKGWTRNYYRYQVWQKEGDNSTYITILDQSRELSPSFRVLNVSIAGEIAGIIITLITLIIVSKFFVLPLERSNREQKRFINDAADALKNPIIVLDTQIEMLEDNDSKELMHKAIADLKNLAIGLDGLMPYELEHVDENIKEFDLSNLVTDVSTVNKAKFDEENKALEINVSEGILLTADEIKIRELLNIVLDNALKYSLSKASISLNEENERKTLIVTNDYDKPLEGDLDSVFERFYRSNDVKESGIDGMGLSLPLAKEIVSSYHGRIKAYGENNMFVLKIEL